MASEDGTDYRVTLIDVYLKLRKVKISPTISMAHEVALKKEPAIHPICRVECKSVVIPARNPSLRKDNVFNGLIPKSFVCGLVASAAFNGAYKQNPFNLKHFNVWFVGVPVNGEEVPFKGMQLSYSTIPRYIEAFYRLFSGTGKMNDNTGNDIWRKEFIGGNVIYCYDLTPDMCGAAQHFNAVQRGNFAVDIKFSIAPAVA